MFGGRDPCAGRGAERGELDTGRRGVSPGWTMSEAQGWLEIAADYERRLTGCEQRALTLELALTSAIVCDTCLGARIISRQCTACLEGEGVRPCTCDEMPEFDCPQCDGRGWYHRDPERFKGICQELYDKHLNYLPREKP